MDIPKKIYLQWFNGDNGEGVTWCEDRQNDTDIEYIHVSEMRKAFKKYGQHHPGCIYNTQCQTYPDKCSCGYLEVLLEVLKEE